ncbi:acetoacetate--CoA ligase [Microbacterium sp. PMB16]|uniref:acetoacetate--CoA ligase n=1 Tax=Microbacterium sp. PMB16 TaxID=3120157 RepID=UPI003F4B7C5A
MSDTPLGTLLRSVPDDARESSVLGDYLGWLEREHDLAFEGYDDLQRWSVDDLDAFWQSIWDFFGVRSHAPHTAVLANSAMPGAKWFPGAILNYAEHIIGADRDPSLVALIERSQTRSPRQLTHGELADLVARARAGLQRLGVKMGDRVVAYLPNIEETAVAYLATISLGAIWASCAPEFGARAVIDRFGQIEPTVMLVAPGYTYGATVVDRRAEIAAIRDGLPSLTHVISVPYGPFEVSDSLSWAELVAEPAMIAFEPVPFDHPMVVLFTSGTTGRPKAIIHGHGGLLLEHLKCQGLMWDLREGDRLLWFSTTAWMLWNVVISALLHGAAAVLVDGNPLYPDVSAQWRIAEETRSTLVGISPGYAMACRKERIEPARLFDLSAVRQIGCAGAPLAPSGAAWLAEEFGQEVLLNVGSGGTDVCTALVTGSPLQPVYAGEMSGRSLGCAVDVFDASGRSVVGDLGELVLTRPMPSMPLGFWGDADGSRERETYFGMYPGVWRMGDWASVTSRGSIVVTGRSDATLNRGGVRVGTADVYSVVEDIDEVLDSLVVHLEDPDGGSGDLLLFLVTADGHVDDDLQVRVKSRMRAELSPRHVPDQIMAIDSVPRGRTGKKLEVPVKRVLLGESPDTAVSRESMTNPKSLDFFVGIRPVGLGQRA